MAIRGILFDKDGTLIDFPSTWTPVLQALALEFAKGDRGAPTTSWRRPATIIGSGCSGRDRSGRQATRSIW
jgi:phosphoglycolate phosphatase-like HAD superfamily hydrolase